MHGGITERTTSMRSCRNCSIVSKKNCVWDMQGLMGQLHVYGCAWVRGMGQGMAAWEYGRMGAWPHGGMAACLMGKALSVYFVHTLLGSYLTS